MKWINSDKCMRKIKLNIIHAMLMIYTRNIKILTIKWKLKVLVNHP